MKQLVIIAIFVTIINVSFAENAFGVRGIGGINLGKVEADILADMSDSLGTSLNEAFEVNTSHSTESDISINGGFSVFMHHSFPTVPALGIQGELTVLFHNGAEITGYASGGDYKVVEIIRASFSTLEIPLLLTYTFCKGKTFEIMPEIGLNLAFPMSNFETENDIKISYKNQAYSDSNVGIGEIDTKCLFGLVVGVSGAYVVTDTTALVFDVRYQVDFNRLVIEDEDFMRRHIVLISTGIRYTMP